MNLIFVAGIVVWEILTRKKPHEDLDIMDAAYKIKNEGLHPEIPENVIPELKHLMEQCWQIIPDNRPTFSQICDQLDSFQWE